VRSPESIIEDLTDSRCDVFIDNRRINYELAKNVVPGEGVGFNRSDYIRLAYKRYCALRNSDTVAKASLEGAGGEAH